MQQELLTFAQTLAGHYSNAKQSRDNPKDFAHINIYFLPLDHAVLNGPGFYSEQSYDHDPWRPYRQGIHRLRQQDNTFIVENFGFPDAIRLAGAGQRPDLLKSIDPSRLSERCGCAMHFTMQSEGRYQGCVEPGERCLVPRDGKMTYLISEVDVDQTTWVSRDRGFDPKTHEQIWGSEHGPLCFERKKFFSDLITPDWLA